MQTADAIVVFAKSPAAGAVKTRLRDALSPSEAAEVHQVCLLDSLRLVEALPQASRWLVLAPPAGPAPTRSPKAEGFSATRGSAALAALEPAPFAIALGDGWRYGWQCGGDLGRRLEAAFAELFRQRARKVVVIGTDTPWMGSQRLRLALDWLNRDDFVLGPALDGGYYLIAARRLAPKAFRAIPGGTREVLSATRRARERAGCSYRLLPVDFDLDRPDDLRRAAQILRADPTRAPHLARWVARWGNLSPSAAQGSSSSRP